MGGFDKMLTEVPKMKMITPSILSDGLRINGSLARATIAHLESEGLIRPICKHSAQLIYTRATNVPPPNKVLRATGTVNLKNKDIGSCRVIHNGQSSVLK